MAANTSSRNSIKAIIQRFLRGSWFSLDEQGCCDVPTSAPESLPESEGQYYHLEQYKSLLIFPGMAGCIVDMVTCPPYACNGQTARTLCPKGCAVASRVFHAQLAKERCLILWGQSAPAKMVPFPQKAAVICGTPIVKGITIMRIKEVLGPWPRAQEAAGLKERKPKRGGSSK